MFVRAAGRRWRSGLRMVIAVNRFNDPRRSRVQWASTDDRLPYGTTDRLEGELAAAVADWQGQGGAAATGIGPAIRQTVGAPARGNRPTGKRGVMRERAIG